MSNNLKEKVFNCAFGEKCLGDSINIKKEYTCFPAIRDENSVCCQKCLFTVIDVRNKYLTKYRDSGNCFPEDGCAYCGGYNYSCKLRNNNGIIESYDSKYGAFCCLICAFNDSCQRADAS